MFRQQLISHEEAIQNASHREALTMALRGITSSASVTEASHATSEKPKPLGGKHV